MIDDDLDIDPRLDEHLRRTLRAVAATGADETFVSGSVPDAKTRHRRIRPATLAAACIALVALLAAIVAVRQRSEPTAPTSPPTTPPPLRSIVSRLLYPTATNQRTPTLSVMNAPAAQVGLVQSPTGSLFSMRIGSLSVDDAPSSTTDRRDINGRTFTVTRRDGAAVYTSAASCSTITIEQLDTSNGFWNDDALALLAATTVRGQRVVVKLPHPWTSLGFGAQQQSIQLGYLTNVNGTAQQVVLVQSPGAPIAAFVGGQGPFTQTTINGQPAWASEAPDPAKIAVLAWDDNGTAVSLLSVQMTVAELTQVAATLQHDRSDDWDRQLQGAIHGIEPTTTTTNASPNTSSKPCGPTNLSITRT